MKRLMWLTILIVLAISAKGQFLYQVDHSSTVSLLYQLNLAYQNQGAKFSRNDFFSPPAVSKIGKIKYDIILNRTRKSANPSNLDNIIGRIYFNEKSYLIAEQFFLTNAMLLSQKPKAFRVKTFINLGDLYSSSGLEEKALKYYQKAFTEIPDASALTFRYRIVNAILKLEIGLGQVSKSEQLISKFRDFDKPKTKIDSFYYQVITGNVASLENPDKAEKNFLRALEISKKIGLYQYDCYKELAGVKIRGGENVQAKALLLQAEKISEGNSFFDNVGLQQMLSDTYIKLKDYKLAHHHLVRKKVLKDSTFQAQRSKNLLELEFKYQLYGKENQLAEEANNILLLGQDTKYLSKAEQGRAIALEKSSIEARQRKDNLSIKQKNLALLSASLRAEENNLSWEKKVKNWIVVFTLLSLFVFLLLFRHYQFKIKSNKIIKHKNDQLDELLMDKKWLLSQMHERIGVNLETIISLLKVNPDNLDAESAEALQISEHRIFAMLLIHKKLFGSELSDEIDMKEYVETLVCNLKQSFSENQLIEIRLDIEKIYFEPEQAAPLGIIINECITNCFKYAFPNNISGLIEISLATTVQNIARLVIRDNGMGLPPNFSLAESRSLGFKLIKGLTSQIDGRLSILCDNGTSVIIANIAMVNKSKKEIYNRQEEIINVNQFENEI